MNVSAWHHYGRFRPLWLGMMVCLSVLPFLGSRSPAPESVPSASPGNVEIVRTFTQAFNQRKIEALLSLVAADVQWLNVSGNKTEVEVDGKPALEKWVRGYFKSCPSCRSELTSLMAAGTHVTVYERARWEAKSGPQSQTSLGVYEVRAGLIRRVWYFPAEKE